MASRPPPDWRGWRVRGASAFPEAPISREGPGESGYESLGKHRVKNIAEPVRAYRVLKKPDTIEAFGKMWLIVPAGNVALAITVHSWRCRYCGGQGLSNTYFRSSSPPCGVASLRKKTALPLPDKPSIAVLPFENMTGDPKQEYFADGFTEQIITSLSKISSLFVISRNSSFSYKGKPVKVQQVSEELGVRYVLEGSVQKSSDRMRINVQLIDAISGSARVGRNYDRELKDIFASSGRDHSEDR